MSYYFSLGIDRIGLTPLKTFVSFIPADLPLIEVGSGNGLVAQYLSQDRKNRIICIDPLLRHFLGRPEDCGGLKPDFATVQDLLQTSNHLVGNCAILLNWPYPNGSTYDMEAIHLLRPRFIVVLYDLYGIAGGYDLIAWMTKRDDNHRGYRRVLRHQLSCLDDFNMEITVSLCLLQSKNIDNTPIPRRRRPREFRNVKKPEVYLG